MILCMTKAEIKNTKIDNYISATESVISNNKMNSNEHLWIASLILCCESIHICFELWIAYFIWNTQKKLTCMHTRYNFVSLFLHNNPYCALRSSVIFLLLPPVHSCHAQFINTVNLFPIIGLDTSREKKTMFRLFLLNFFSFYVFFFENGSFYHVRIDLWIFFQRNWVFFTFNVSISYQSIEQYDKCYYYDRYAYFIALDIIFSVQFDRI